MIFMKFTYTEPCHEFGALMQLLPALLEPFPFWVVVWVSSLHTQGPETPSVGILLDFQVVLSCQLAFPTVPLCSSPHVLSVYRMK